MHKENLKKKLSHYKDDVTITNDIKARIDKTQENRKSKLRRERERER